MARSSGRSIAARDTIWQDPEFSFNSAVDKGEIDWYRLEG